MGVYKASVSTFLRLNDGHVTSWRGMGQLSSHGDLQPPAHSFAANHAEITNRIEDGIDRQKLPRVGAKRIFLHAENLPQNK